MKTPIKPNPDYKPDDSDILLPNGTVDKILFAQKAIDYIPDKINEEYDMLVEDYCTKPLLWDVSNEDIAKGIADSYFFSGTAYSAALDVLKIKEQILIDNAFWFAKYYYTDGGASLWPDYYTDLSSSMKGKKLISRREYKGLTPQKREIMHWENLLDFVEAAVIKSGYIPKIFPETETDIAKQCYETLNRLRHDIEATIKKLKEKNI